MNQYDARWLQAYRLHFLPRPAPQKIFNGRVVNDDNLSRDRDIRREQNYTPGRSIYLFLKKELARKVIAGDQLESDLGPEN